MHVYKWLWVSGKFSLTCSNSTLRFEISHNVLNQIVAFWTTCSINILNMFKVLYRMTRNWNRFEFKKLWIFYLNMFNYKLNKLVWFLAITISCVGSIMGTIGSTNSTSSTWMLSITWSKLGSSFSSMLPCVAVTLKKIPSPPPISSEQVRSSSSSKSITYDSKVVINFFFGGEETSSRLNLSLGVGDFGCIFSWWDWHVGKGDVVVEHVGLFSFKNYSLVTCLGETCCCTTCHSWLVSDIGFSRVDVIGEGTSDKGNHFLNRIYRIGHE